MQPSQCRPLRPTCSVCAGCVVGGLYLLQPKLWKRPGLQDSLRSSPGPFTARCLFVESAWERPLPSPQGRAVCCSCGRCSWASWPALVLWEPRAPAAGKPGLMLSPGTVPSLLLTPPVQVTTTDAGNICPELIHSITATRGTAASSVCSRLPGFLVSTSPREKSNCFPSLAANPLHWAFSSLS